MCLHPSYVCDSAVPWNLRISKIVVVCSPEEEQCSDGGVGDLMLIRCSSLEHLLPRATTAVFWMSIGSRKSGGFNSLDSPASVRFAMGDAQHT